MTGEKKTERVNKIINDPEYLELIKKNKRSEKGRKFCKHNVEHYLSVARIALILNLEGGYNIDAELIYAAALLHDIGRFRQYIDKTPHEIASKELAEPILKSVGFTEKETAEILDAIKAHRTGENVKKGGLAEVLFKADKLSRNCMFCKAKDMCNWAHKNGELTV